MFAHPRFSLSIALLVLTAGCLDTKADPGYCATCKVDGGAGSGAGNGADAKVADGAIGGDAKVADAAVDAGGGADAAVDAGGGGDGSTSACVQSCTGNKPACDAVTKKCVQCTASDDDACDGDTSVCDVASKKCVECTAADADACKGKTPVCDAAKSECVECNADADCKDASKAQCSAHKCVPCNAPTQCAHVTKAGKTLGICDSGDCVECTGTNYAACGKDGANKVLVCDSKARTCSTKTEGEALVCQPCISDAHCRAGTACMQTKLGAADTGSYCLWKKDTAGAGAPNGDCLTVRPYVGTETGWQSLDGQTSTVCKPARTTCEAQNTFLNQSCDGATTEGHAQCGVAGVNDAYCAPFGGNHFCTVPCVSYLDCQETRPGDDMECQQQTLGEVAIKVCQFQ